MRGMWFDILYKIYVILKFWWECALYFLRIAGPHTAKIIFVANLVIAYYCWSALVEAEEFSRMASGALTNCQEALAFEKAANKEMAEQTIQAFNTKQSKKAILVVMSLLFVIHWGFLIIRLDLSRNGPPGGGGNAHVRFSEELIEADPSVLVPENSAVIVSPVIEMICNLIAFCLT